MLFTQPVTTEDGGGALAHSAVLFQAKMKAGRLFDVHAVGSLNGSGAAVAALIHLFTRDQLTGSLAH